MRRAARIVFSLALGTMMGCTIYGTSLLVGGDGGGGGDGGHHKDGPADAPSAPCKTGTTRCTGKSQEKCVKGNWVVVQTCSQGCDDAGTCKENPSCKGGGPGADQTCGPGGNEDCCAALPVPGGAFLRSGVDGGQATVSGFTLDEFEVTVGRYRKFVNAGKGTQINPPAQGDGANPHVMGSGWDSSWDKELPSATNSLETSFNCSIEPTWTNSIGDNDDLPMNCLTWYEAFAFCAGDGGRLPTEAEWNFAAAGGGENRWFPWSNPPNSQTITPQFAAYDCTAHNGGPPQFGDGGDSGPILLCELSDILPVGFRPKGNARWGHADMAGNVAEWTLDWFANPYPLPCDNCAELDGGMPDGGPVRVFRGGGYYYQDTLLPTWVRLTDYPTSRDDSYGVRCARD